MRYCAGVAARSRDRSRAPLDESLTPALTGEAPAR